MTREEWIKFWSEEIGRPPKITNHNQGCKYCDRKDNDFVLLNETTDYSGVEMSLNRQGMLRTRYYDDSSHIWFSEDIVNINFCPICGRKLTEG